MRQSGQERSILDLLQDMKEMYRRPLHAANIDVAATIRANIGYLKRMATETTQISATTAMSEMTIQYYRKKQQTSLLFVVDASRSQGSHARLAFVKGAVEAILTKAYTKRDKVGVIIFRDREAQILLPFTKSVDFAAQQMTQLTAKGNTPLAEGIRLAITTMTQEIHKYPDNLPMIVLLTDGKCNYDKGKGQPLKQALAAAEELKKRQLPVLVVDTENSVFGMGLARKIAEASGGEYVKML